MFSVQVDIDVLAAARAVMLSHTVKHDLDMLIKTVLTEAFGGAVVRPWSLHRQAGQIGTVIGYSAIPLADVETRLGTALPSIRMAIKAVYGHALPAPTAGQKFRFSVRLCPMKRITPSKDKSHAHGEIDAFLVAVQRGRLTPRSTVKNSPRTWIRSQGRRANTREGNRVSNDNRRPITLV
jgi:hypothetical protein